MIDLDFRKASSMVRAALVAALLFSVPFFVVGLNLPPPVLVALIATGGMLGAVLAVTSSGSGLGIGGGPILGILAAGWGALIQTLASFALVGDHSNPVGEKLLVLWKWALGEYGWTLPGSLSLLLRANMGWLKVPVLNASVVSSLAVYSFLASVLPAAVGASVGAVLLGIGDLFGKKPGSGGPSSPGPAPPEPSPPAPVPGVDGRLGL